MPLFYIDNAGKYGLVSDTAAHQLPPEAWSDGKNVRFRDGYCENVGGHTVLTTPQIVPYGLFPVIYTGYTMWVYAGLAKVRCYDFAHDDDITRASGDYNMGEGQRWTGGMYNGVFILNNPNDAPQMWQPVGAGVKLQDLTNWPENTRARVVRPYGAFLVALGVTVGHRDYLQRVRWSHPAAPGNVPANWDVSNVNSDAGEVDLSQTSDLCVDMLPLRGGNIIYKEDSTWLMRFVGGSRIFDFTLLSGTSGALGVDCAKEIDGQHLVLGQDDLVIHDGLSAPKSILNNRRRRYLFNTISAKYGGRSFISVNHAAKEAWVCYPTGNDPWPTEALIWNYADNTIGHRELPPDATALAFGQLNETEGLLRWSDLGTDNGDRWEIPPGTETGSLVANYPWDVVTKRRTNMGLIMASSEPDLYVMDSGAMFHENTPTCRVERLALVKPRNNSDNRTDFNLDSYGHIREVWPVMTADAAASVNIYVAAQKVVGGAVTWYGPFAYAPDTDVKIDCQVPGRFLGIRIQSTTAIRWKLYGYGVRVEKGGLYQ